MLQRFWDEPEIICVQCTLYNPHSVVFPRGGMMVPVFDLWRFSIICILHIISDQLLSARLWFQLAPTAECALSTDAPGGAEWYTYMYIMEIKTCWLKIENPVVLLRNRNPLNPNSPACSGINCIRRIPIAPGAISKWLARPRRSVGLT